MASCFLSLVKTNFELFIVKMEWKFSLLNKVFHKWTAFFIFQPYHSILRREITGVMNVPVWCLERWKKKPNKHWERVVGGGGGGGVKTYKKAEAHDNQTHLYFLMEEITQMLCTRVLFLRHGSYYISQLVRAVWLVNFVGAISLHGPLNSVDRFPWLQLVSFPARLIDLKDIINILLTSFSRSVL